MVACDIFFSCKECGEEHPVGLKIQIPDGPNRKISIGAFYASKEIPEEINKLSEKLFECPKTKNSFFHSDISQLFLVPVE